LKSDTVYVAPFVGEFGWECMMWAPWLRNQKHCRAKPFMVLCEYGKAALYEDFAKVIEIDPIPTKKRDCQHGFDDERGKFDRRFYADVVFAATAGFHRPTLTPLDLKVLWPADYPPTPIGAKHHSLHVEVDEPYNLIAVHARSLDRVPLRNWSPVKWDELVDKLKFEGYHVFAIGSKGEALCPSGCEDMRGASLHELSRVLSRTDAVIGPSSGPLHFANLCKTPVVWWSANGKDIKRYSTYWNPFNCENVQVTRSWKPTIDEVLQCTMTF
jgi:ADP-heptose:LPS heptosyltransferase